MGKAKKPEVAADEAGSAATGEAEALSLESALEQLESTARRLEQGDLPLEEALALFETGVALTRRCTETLEAAERRIEILVADREARGGFAEQAFEVEDEVDDLDGEDEADDFEDEV